MKKNTSPQKLDIVVDNPAITERARSIVKKLVESGKTTYAEVAQLTDSTVLSLLEDGTPLLKETQFNLLAKHYHISLQWLWTGKGPQFTSHNN